MSIVKNINGSNNEPDYISANYAYVTDPVKTDNGKLVGAVNCSVKHAVKDMMTVKKVNHKTHGKQAFNMVISITPDLPSVGDEVYMNIAEKVAQRFDKHQSFYAVHKDSKYRHIHITTNSVSYETGLKYSQSKKELNNTKVYINHLLEKYGLDIIKTSVDDMLDNSAYSIDDGFDFLEIQDDKPEPKVSVIVDTEDDLEFCDNTEIKNSNEKNTTVVTICDKKTEEIDMTNFNQNNNIILSEQYPVQESYNCPPETFYYPTTAPIMNGGYYPQITPAYNGYPQTMMPVQQPMPLPTLRLCFNRNLHLNVPQHIDPNLMNGYVNSLKVSPQEYIEKTKLGIAVMGKLQQQGISGDVAIEMDINIDITLPDFNTTENNVINTPFEKIKK